MNPNQMTDAKLSLWLGKVLQPEKNEHDTRRMDRAMANHKPPYCRKCDRKVPYSEPCPIPDPIPLTPAEAFKWRDWAVERGLEYHYMEALWAVFCALKGYDTGCSVPSEFSYWLGTEARSREFLIAAAKCKENSK